MKQLMQHFAGYIVELYDNDFGVHLIDMTNRSNPDEFAVIPFENVPNLNREDLKVGTLLTWKMYGSEDDEKCESEITLTPVPVVTKEMLDEARKRGRILGKLFLSKVD